MIHPKIAEKLPFKFKDLIEIGYHPLYDIILKCLDDVYDNEGICVKLKGDITYVKKYYVNSDGDLERYVHIENNKYCVNFPNSLFKIIG